MGYTTDFIGSFKLSSVLTFDQVNYLRNFSETRRMSRHSNKLLNVPDPIRKAVNLPLGEEGEYYIGNKGDNFGQNHDESIIDYNEPPKTQPGLWCKWTVGKDNQSIEWDGCEKFYHYKEWLEYIIDNFLKPWGHTLNGIVEYQGEDPDDSGEITVTNNIVTMD